MLKHVKTTIVAGEIPICPGSLPIFTYFIFTGFYGFYIPKSIPKSIHFGPPIFCSTLGSRVHGRSDPAPPRDPPLRSPRPNRFRCSPREEASGMDSGQGQEKRDESWGEWCPGSQHRNPNIMGLI